ncbi:MAG TPA: FHA domain-containing protein [Polyangiaceae bacterium]|nr:FHA domain-containing protein [Polyangiaceae bacterium]
MSACSQCGTVVKPSDKFCNICGSPIARPVSSAPPVGAPYAVTGFAPQGQPLPGYGGQPAAPAPPQPPRCQLGHEIAPGASYCMHGHPIALDQMQFAADAYGAGYGQAPAQAYPGQRGAAAPPPYTPAPPPGYGGSPAQQAHPATFTPPPPQSPYSSAFGTAGPQPGYAQQAPPPYPPVPQPNPYAYQHEPPREAPPKVLRGFLVAYGTNPSGDFWPLTGGRHTIGRFGTGDGLDIALQDPTISSRHAAIVVDGSSGSVGLEDTGSTNGTFVNDEHIGYGGRRELKDGDRIRFGGFTTVVKVIGRV